MLMYPGRELYNKIDKIVSTAFYKDYTHCEENWYSVDSILLNYAANENSDDLPLITVEITFAGYSTTASTIEVDLWLDRSDEFNAGIVLAEFEKCD